MHSVPGLQVELCCLSDAGQDPSKQINEDTGRAVVTRFGQLALVCDGMGGHSHGRAASQAAVDTIIQRLESADAKTPGEALVEAIQAANRTVYAQGSGPEMEGRPGSTCVALLVHEQGADVAHVGDSRAFLLRSGQISRMTRDHSVVQQMLDANLITEEQALEHPDSNRITRALGMAPQVDVELRRGPLPIAAGDVFLLASDGLTDLLSDQELLSVATNRGAEGVQAACQALVDTANMRGGHDNITVLLLKITGTSATAKVTTPRQAAPASFDGPKTVLDTAAAPTQVDAAAPPTQLEAAAATLVSDSTTRTGTEPGLQQSPFYRSTPDVRNQFPSEYPDRVSMLTRNGKNLLLLAAAFTVVIVGAIVLWWIVAALSGPADDVSPPAPTSALFSESGSQT